MPFIPAHRPLPISIPSPSTQVWGANLLVTWVLVEPGEIFGLIFFPKLFAGRAAWCRTKLKQLGVYG